MVARLLLLFLLLEKSISTLSIENRYLFTVKIPFVEYDFNKKTELKIIFCINILNLQHYIDNLVFLEL
jgi:hypothetical protein